MIQVDISPTEIDSNRGVAAPVVGDTRSAMGAFLAALEPGQVKPRVEWLNALGEHKRKNVDRMAAELSADPHPMNFSSALRAIRDVLADKRNVFVVNEGANTLDFGRNIIDMYEPRKRLDCGTLSVMGVGQGYAIAATVVSGEPVVAIEGDSAFGFSGMNWRRFAGITFRSSSWCSTITESTAAIHPEHIRLLRQDSFRMLGTTR